MLAVPGEVLSAIIQVRLISADLLIIFSGVFAQLPLAGTSSLPRAVFVGVPGPPTRGGDSLGILRLDLKMPGGVQRPTKREAADWAGSPLQGWGESAGAHPALGQHLLKTPLRGG